MIEATYEGSTFFTASNSTDQTVSVVQATPTTILVATPRKVRLKGTQARRSRCSFSRNSPAAPVPTGSVTFDIGRRKLRTVPLVNGSASVAVAASKARGKNFVVDYLGDANYKIAQSDVVHIAPKFFKAKVR